MCSVSGVLYNFFIILSDDMVFLFPEALFNSHAPPHPPGISETLKTLPKPPVEDRIEWFGLNSEYLLAEVKIVI